MHQLGYMTCANQDEARQIVRVLLEKKLIACANILPSMTACFQWENEMKEEAETAVIFKTTRSAFKPIEAIVQDMHSYDCPCVIALDIAQGYGPFLQWISDETASEAG